MAEDLACAVCGQSVTDAALLSECGTCGAAFHLNPRADVEGIDCGDVWTGGPEAPALQFYCRPCIDRTQGAARAQDAVTTAGSPAMPPGMQSLPPGAPPEMLAAMAGWATPEGAAPQPSPTTSHDAPDAPPPVTPRPRRRRRFRRVDTD